MGTLSFRRLDDRIDNIFQSNPIPIFWQMRLSLDYVHSFHHYPYLPVPRQGEFFKWPRLVRSPTMKNSKKYGVSGLIFMITKTAS